MEKGTKRIVAIVLIVIIGATIGISAWMFLGQPKAWTADDCPGAPEDITPDQIIKIGVLNGLTEIQGEAAWNGLWLAAYEINKAGGVVIDGKQYYYGVVGEDTYEADVILDTTKGVSAAQRIVNYDQVQFLMGGFRTESLLAYQEVVMDAGIMFINTGSATDIFCQNVLDNYDRYKYMFRIMPINSTSLAMEIITHVIYTAAYLSAVLSTDVSRVAILREDLDWTVPMKAALGYYLANNPVKNLTIVKDIAYPITAEASHFAGYWAEIDAAKAQLTVPIISAQGGILMMKQYKATEPNCLVLGIDVMGQLDTYWNQTDGACAYEIGMIPAINSPKTSITQRFYNAYMGNFSTSPLYTGVGCYDAMYLYHYAIDSAQSLDTDTLIAEFEKWTIDNPMPVGVSSPGAAFYESHDVVEGYPYGYTLFFQWQDGAMECIPSAVYPYMDPVTSALGWPTWVDFVTYT